MNNNLNYLNKRQAILKAGTDVEEALKVILNTFKGFQDDYLSLLEDHQQMKLTLQKLQEDKKNICGHDNKKADAPVNLLSNNNKSFINDFTIDSDSPGVVENTQLESRSKIKLKLLDKKKLNGKVKSPVKIKSPVKSNRSPSKSGVKENRIPELTINRITSVQQKLSDSKVGKLGLSKTDVQISLTPSGKISRQSKLVLTQPKRKLLLTNPDESHNNNNNDSTNYSKSIINPDDLNFDTTLFEIPFTQEKTPEKKSLEHREEEKIVAKNYNPFKNQSTPKINNASDRNKTARVDESQSLIRSVNKKSVERKSQSEIATCITQDLNQTDNINESDFFSLDNNVDFESQDLDSINLSPDETYCDDAESILKRKKAVSDNRDDAGTSGIKRKFEAIAGPSNVDNKINNNNISNKLTPDELKELEVVNISDWDTDTSSDKWPSTPLKKRVPVDSFDRIPEKKKTSPQNAYKGDVVRKKDERAKLRGWDCSDCEKYYNTIGLSEKEKRERKNQCSRHRSKFNERYYTPPGFWDPVFPDTIDSSQENN
ncbi:DNA endonuclease RBBP8 [Microplitis mediator]|uniref:DNA endonuclease RBBP8 n=1 Tax=Microplitis mediator TaxID=375433 RepID=UPI002552DB30|nr:DNA endonuclease RBBP8 [Microplitis mediator]